MSRTTAPPLTPSPPTPAAAPAEPPPPAGLTLEQFLDRYAVAHVEVVDGVVKDLPMPQPHHGHVCFKIPLDLGGFIETNQLATVCTNDTFALIWREPLRVRGADAVYWSRVRLPEGIPPRGIIEVPQTW